MNNIKRKSSMNHLSFSNKVNRSISCIDNLANECFYEIFDYLDGCEIYQAFSNLNSRFEQLLNSASLLFKIEFDHLTSEEFFLTNYHQIMSHHYHQIYSIHLFIKEDMYRITSLFVVHSRFIHLESLVLYDIEANLLHKLLKNFIELPRLFSFDINTESDFTLREISDVYLLLFALPKLKSIKFDTDIDDDSHSILPLSIAANKQFSSIKRLCICHSCSFRELFSIISYTPELSHLKLSYAVADDEPNLENLIPISLPKLIDLSMKRYEMRFNELNFFVKNIILCKLEVLYLKIEYDDITCFDANQWEELIRKYFPQLKKFYLKYEEYGRNEHKILDNSDQLNQFFSSFWIERQWILEIEIHNRYIIYTICPYKKKWYEDTQNNIVNSSMQLILKNDLYSEEFFHLLKSRIDHLLTVRQIYDLVVSEITLSALIKIINFLPKLGSLKVSSLSLKQSKCLSYQEIDLLDLITNQNQITKIYLEKITNVEEVCFLLELCPRMIYLKVDFINNIDIELFLRIILLKIQTKCNHQLRLLSFSIPTADDQMIKQLQTMIHFEKFLLNYTIKRMMDNIILQWT